MPYVLLQHLLVALIFTTLITNIDLTRVNVSCSSSKCVHLPFVSVPESVRVNESFLTRTASGQYRITGNVTAQSGRPVYNVSVSARLYDRNSQLIEVVTGSTVLSATLPSQLNPFDMVAQSTVFSTTVFTTEVDILGWTFNTNQEFKPLAVVMSDTSDLNYEVTVKLRNDQTQTLYSVQAVTWALNQCFAINRREVAGAIAPGGTVSFTAILGVPICSPITKESIRVAAQGTTAP